MKKVMKKLLMAVTGVCFGVVLFVAVPEKAYAYPCTIDIINSARAQKSAADAELLAALANQAAANQAVTAVKASGASQLELQQAYDNASTAANLVHAAVDKVNNAQAFIDNATKRLATEDEYEANVVKWGNQVKIANAKHEATYAKQVADYAAAVVAATKQGIASRASQISVSPSLQGQMDSLTASLPALEADAAAKLVIANEKAAIVANMKATLVH